MSYLSDGPFSYNRFDAMDKAYNKMYAPQEVAEGKKPDFLDLDKDGDKKESMKKASDDKKDSKKKCECKEDVINYLMTERFANNPVSAEVIYNAMSDQWLAHVMSD